MNRPTENADVKIVAVDLQLMAPIPGVVQIHGDITKVNFFFNHLNGQLLIPNLFRALPGSRAHKVSAGA